MWWIWSGELQLIISFIVCSVGGLVFYYIEKVITKWNIYKIEGDSKIYAK